MGWIYSKDNDHPVCECPYCHKRMFTGMYWPENYYLFCPYCGAQNSLVPDRLKKDKYGLSTEGKADD